MKTLMEIDRRGDLITVTDADGFVAHFAPEHADKARAMIDQHNAEVREKQQRDDLVSARRDAQEGRR